MQKRLFHFSYSQQQSRSDPLLHALRDGDAFAEIEAVLLKNEGYDYGGLIFNFSSPDTELNLSVFGASDLLVLTTRPPTPYEYEREKKHMELSGEKLEKVILDVVKLYFKQHSRSHVKLSSEMAAMLTKPDRGEIEFGQHHGVRYLRHRNPHIKNREQAKWTKLPKETKLAAAFVLFTNLWAGGPLFLNVFGMDGPTTLIWCYLLRTRFAEYLKPHRLIMAELTTEPFPRRPLSLSFANQWNVEILLNQELQQNNHAGPDEGQY